MIGKASASVFSMTGSSMSSGRRPRTRATLSRTSWAASSIGRSRLNSRVMVAICSWLLLVRVRSPSTLVSSSSSTSVTADSITCGLAPGRITVTVTTGASASGNSRTASRVYPMMPTSTMPRLTIEESTGRRMKSSAKCISGSSRGRSTTKGRPEHMPKNEGGQRRCRKTGTGPFSLLSNGSACFRRASVRTSHTEPRNENNLLGNGRVCYRVLQSPDPGGGGVTGQLGGCVSGGRR